MFILPFLYGGSKIMRLRHIYRNLFRIKLYPALHRKPLWTVQPTCIQIDTHNFCNLACIHCNPQGCYIKDQKFLSMDTIRNVLQYFAERHLPISYVRPFINGEPLLEKRLPQITKAVKQVLHCETHIYSNATVYENRHLLIDQNLDTVKFTVSAASPETYRKVHGKPLFGFKNDIVVQPEQAIPPESLDQLCTMRT